MANDKGLTRSVTVKNVQVKPQTGTPISSYAPPKPVSVASTAAKVLVNSKK